MNLALALKRPHQPDPGSGVLFYSLIAAAGFAFGWATQALGAF